MDVLKDEGRRLYRFVKRTEMLVSEIQPFCQAAGQWEVPTLMLSALQRLQTLLHEIWSFIDDCCNLGKIPLYMQVNESYSVQFHSSIRLVHEHKHTFLFQNNQTCRG
jgi:hypothetical protein